jgi:hypothetical protein
VTTFEDRGVAWSARRILTAVFSIFLDRELDTMRTEKSNFVYSKIVHSCLSGTMDLVKGLNRRGLSVGLRDLTDPQLPSAINVARHTLGAVVIVGSQISAAAEEFLEQVNESTCLSRSHKLIGRRYLRANLITSYILLQRLHGFVVLCTT